MTMPQPRGCRGSSKVRAVNSISRICSFPSPIKTHFFVFGCAESEKNFTSVGIFHRSGKGVRQILRKIRCRLSGGAFLSFALPRFERKTLLFLGLSSRRRFPTADIGEYGKNEKGAVCFMHTAPFLLSLISARKRALCHCPPKTRCRQTKSFVSSGN